MAKKELLAPAGDIEAGYAALYYGADAVYLGLQQFSARATATNFNEAELNEFAGYAHSLNRKVFVAINTVVKENELADLIKALDICRRCRVDAVIIQDLGVARVVREKYPDLEMHASTQMAVHNKAGALALKEFGFKRVVLARELTAAEIKEIAAIPDLETEAFIHGALCYSYSGLCLFSAMETGKSANRGKCVYPCRVCFKGEDGEKHYFSMKDMALEEDVLKMPAYSLKIEGRKKTALYVAAVTDFYRRILDGKGADAERGDNIKQIFSRPWCKFHFNGRDKEVIDRDFVGHRGLLIGKAEQVAGGKIIFRPNHGIARHDGLQIDVFGYEKPLGFSLQKLRVNGKNVFEAKAGETVEVGLPPQIANVKKGDKIYLASASAVKGAYPYAKPRPGEYVNKPAVDVMVEIEEKWLRARAGNVENVLEGLFATADNPAKMQEAVRKAFAKTGDCAFELGALEIKNKDGRFVPVSLLNELRRGLYEKVELKHECGELPQVSEARNVSAPQWIIKADHLDCLAQIDLDEAAEVVFLLDKDTKPEVLKAVPKNKLRLALPAVCRNVRAFEKLIDELLAQGYRKWEISNYWGWEVLPKSGIDLSFDREIYMFNRQAIEAAKEMKASRITLAAEDDPENRQKLAGVSSLPVCVTVWGDVPLFTSAACIRSNPCKSCPRGKKWLSLQKDGKRYDVLSKDCQTMLFAAEPLNDLSEARNIPADFYRVDFMYKTYAPEQAAAIWASLRGCV